MMSNERFAKHLAQLYSGEIKFDLFARITRSDWARMARNLLARWQHPEAVTEEDVAQELLLGAWLATPLWDPERGVPLHSWVTWNAVTRAKKWMHKQRGAVLHGNADRHESRFAVTCSAFLKATEEDGEAPTQDRFECLLVCRADVEERDDWGDIIELVAHDGATPRDRAAREALVMAGGDPELAGKLWFADDVQRMIWWLESEQEAAALVRREVAKVKGIVEEHRRKLSPSQQRNFDAWVIRWMNEKNEEEQNGK